jgi:hypothetical protein
VPLPGEDDPGELARGFWPAPVGAAR